MAKTPTKSWLPKRNASGGRFVAAKEASSSPRTTVTEVTRNIGSGRFVTVKEASNSPHATVAEVFRNAGTGSGSANLRSNVSGRISLPNGQSITTVRKDVMDRALGRGEFKKK